MLIASEPIDCTANFTGRGGIVILSPRSKGLFRKTVYGATSMNNALFVKNAVSQADQPVWLEVVAVQSTRVNTIVRISGTICIYFTFLFFLLFFSSRLSSTRGNEYSRTGDRSIYRGGGGWLFDEIRSNSVETCEILR